MQQLPDHLRTGNDRFAWFRLGLVSATVVTPLVARWRTLRAAERARELWETRVASQRLPWAPRAAGEAALPPLARKNNLSTGIWLAGVVVGLAAAGTATYLWARRRQRSESELLDLTTVQSNGKAPHPAEQARQFFGRSANTRGGPDFENGPAAAASSSGGGSTDATMGPAAAVADLQTGQDTANGIVDPDAAPIVGNIHTMVYHEAGDEAELPEEQNRIYFASAQEAEARGYRPDRAERLGER